MRFVLFLCATLGLAGLAGCASDHQKVTAVQTAQPKIVDVRSPEEFEAGHIQGAINLPVNQVESGIAEVSPDKQAPLWVHCQGGGRSARATAALRKMGYTNVRDLGSLANAKAVASAELK